MRLSSHATAWSTAALLAGLISTVVRASVLEVDLVFPRDGEVYEPTPYMPIIFAVQNPGLTQYTHPALEVRIQNRSNPDDGEGKAYYQPLNVTNWSSNETFFAYTIANNFANEGNWSVAWDVCWRTCGLEEIRWSFDGTLGRNCSRVNRVSGSFFTTRKGGRTVDLVAATANSDSTCISQRRLGYALNITDEVLAISPNESVPGGWPPKCVMATLPEPPLDLDFCRVKIGPALAANISADITARVCEEADPRPSSCPSKSAAWRPTAAATGSCFMAAAAIWGASGFVLG
ncbi:hypothetical protein NEMBOFW57_000083 [Staphylotrichum longicolle]|uniref:DUF7136 domain-containing protein n=1 Tax=Staphylotrichum longicolle TaxID=669026 RepID=A0AAD4HWT0_9PEZI|nr:hypothetical protein NEMBOFW57_000083 [Staphylotrichum longicolle]